MDQIDRISEKLNEMPQNLSQIENEVAIESMAFSEGSIFAEDMKSEKVRDVVVVAQMGGGGMSNQEEEILAFLTEESESKDSLKKVGKRDIDFNSDHAAQMGIL